MATSKEIKTKLEQQAGKRAVRLAELVEWHMERGKAFISICVLRLHDKPVEFELKVYVEKKHKKRINREIGRVMEKIGGQTYDIGPARQVSRKARAGRTIR